MQSNITKLGLCVMLGMASTTTIALEGFVGTAIPAADQYKMDSLTKNFKQDENTPPMMFQARRGGATKDSNTEGSTVSCNYTFKCYTDNFTKVANCSKDTLASVSKVHVNFRDANATGPANFVISAQGGPTFQRNFIIHPNTHNANNGSGGLDVYGNGKVYMGLNFPKSNKAVAEVIASCNIIYNNTSAPGTFK